MRALVAVLILVVVSPLVASAQGAARPPTILRGSAAWNPESLANGGVATTTLALAGAVPGDPCAVGHTTSVATGLEYTCWVSASGVVSIALRNFSGAVRDLDPGTVNVAIFK